MSLKMANQGGNKSSSSNVVLREYRKGNWTVEETMVLIEAKRMDEERRMKRVDHHHHSSSSEASAVRNTNKAPVGELRWKWVEDYCWRNGCLRSQNQCNDKWDNLMRDFKKVRDYERRIVMSDQDHDQFGGQFSYWKMEKIKRKEHNLPSNLLPEIYEALVNVVEKKAAGGQRFFSGGTTSSNSNINVITTVLGHQPINVVHPQVVSTLLPHLQHHNTSSIVLPLPPPPPPQPPLPPPESFPCPQPLTISDSETSGQSNSSAKRRRRGEETSAAAATATAADDRNNNAYDQEVGSAISRSASLIAGAIQANEEREERRHKELLSMHEKRLQIEESKAEINRQGITGMVDAINNLAHSVLALAATNKTPPKP